MSTQLGSDNTESIRRHSFLEALNDDFAALRANQNEWTEEMKERKFWDQTLTDGLETTRHIEEK